MQVSVQQHDGAGQGVNGVLQGQGKHGCLCLFVCYSDLFVCFLVYCFYCVKMSVYACFFYNFV